MPDHLFLCLAPIASLAETSVVALWDEYCERQGFTPLHNALFKIGNDSLASFLDNDCLGDKNIDTPDSKGRSPLTWAVEYGWLEAVELLIAHGADATQERSSFRGSLPLLHLAIAGSDCESPYGGYLDIMTLLVEAGADPDRRDHEGWTPFHVACSWENINAAVHLGGLGNIEYGAKTYDGEDAASLSGDQHFLRRCFAAGPRVLTPSWQTHPSVCSRDYE